MDSKKPAFFSKTATNPAYEYDESKPLYKGQQLVGVMKRGTVYTEGNHKLIEEAVSRDKGLAAPRLVYVGDNYIEDCIAPGKLSNWRPVLVLPELYGTIYYLKDR